MIFPGYLELKDINQYRKNAFQRKITYYNNNKMKCTGVQSLEFEILEAIERIRSINCNIPYVEVIEMGKCDLARNTTNLNPRVYCERWNNDAYAINYNWEMPVKIGRYVGKVFGKNPENWQIKLKEKEGIQYVPFTHSIYEFEEFKRYNVCKSNLSKFIRKMAGWFIGLHELGHIVNGHLQLMEDVKKNKIKLNLNERRALELHADISAATFMLQIMESWQSYVGIRQPVPQLNGKNPGITYCDELAFSALAAYIALRIFLIHERWDEYTINIHEMNCESHPLIELRMAVVYNVFLQGIIDLAENEEEKLAFVTNFYNMIEQFEKFMYANQSETGENNLYYKPTDLLRTEEGKDYYHTIFDSTLKLNELLKGYSITQQTIIGRWVDYNTLPERIYWT